MEAWPSAPVEDVADGAVWLTDPAAEVSYGDLYFLASDRLVRVVVSTPPEYRREPLAIASALSRVAAEGLTN